MEIYKWILPDPNAHCVIRTIWGSLKSIFLLKNMTAGRMSIFTSNLGASAILMSKSNLKGKCLVGEELLIDSLEIQTRNEIRVVGKQRVKPFFVRVLEIGSNRFRLQRCQMCVILRLQRSEDAQQATTSATSLTGHQVTKQFMCSVNNEF